MSKSISLRQITECFKNSDKGASCLCKYTKHCVDKMGFFLKRLNAFLHTPLSHIHILKLSNNCPPHLISIWFASVQFPPSSQERLKVRSLVFKTLLAFSLLSHREHAKTEEYKLGSLPFLSPRADSSFHCWLTQNQTCCLCQLSTTLFLPLKRGQSDTLT